MSDQSQGPGWWQASDGKWYPPEQAPPGYAAPTANIPTVPPVPPTTPIGPPPVSAAPPKSGLGRGPIIGIIAGVIVVLLVAFFLVGRDDGDKKNASATKSSSSESSSSSRSSSSSSRSSSSSSSAASADAPPGFKTITNDGAGVSIAVPEGFVEFDATNAAANASDLASDNPEFGQFLGSATALAGNSVLAARSSGLRPSAVIVAESPQSFDVEDPTLPDQLKQVFGNLGPVKDVSTAAETLAAGPALRLDVALEVAKPDSSTASVHETLFFVNARGSTWVIIGVSGGDDQSDLFDQIAQTLTVS